MSTQLARQNQLKPILLASQRQITSLLSDEVKAKKFMAASLVVASNDSLKNCEAESIVQALIGVAMSDLNIDSNLGQCYILPYGKKAQLQIGYKGFIQLLFRAGWMVKCLPVYHCDEFTMSFDGWDNSVEFKQNIDDRDEGDRDWVYQNFRGVYVVARHADTKDEYSMFVAKAVVEKLRLTSPNQRIGKYTKPEDKDRLQKGLPIGVWADWYIEMAQAKAVKKLAKILPIGDSRESSIIAMDDKTESGVIVDYKETANQENGGVIIEMETSQSDSTYLDGVLNSIANAKSTEELKDLSVEVEKLPEQEKARARHAWIEKANELKANNQPASEVTDWSKAINACKSADELSELMGKLPEIELMNHGDLIDEKFDSFR